jgi:hypothetical protein
MTYLKTLARVAGLGLCVVALSGTALADPGNGNGNGPATTPPGQEQKAETPAASVPIQAPASQAGAGQEQKAENQAQQAVKKAESRPAVKATAAKSTAAKAAARGQAKQAEKRAEKAESKPAKATQSVNSQSANAHHHVIVCHRTGSESNPYVVINIPYTAWTHAHSDTTGSHPDKNGRADKLLKDPASRPGSKDGFTKASCGAPVAPATQVTTTQQSQTSGCPAATATTERVLVGIKHYTGATKNGQRKFVVISPSEKSAHMNGKHADDQAMVETRTVTRTASGENCATVTTTSNTTGTVEIQSTVQAAQSTAPGAQAAAGGVAGAVASESAAPKKNKQPAGGVLGAVASGPAAVAETATSETLPFTGIPLWIAALIGGALLATGLVLRRTA